MASLRAWRQPFIATSLALTSVLLLLGMLPAVAPSAQAVEDRGATRARTLGPSPPRCTWWGEPNCIDETTVGELTLTPHIVRVGQKLHAQVEWEGWPSTYCGTDQHSCTFTFTGESPWIISTAYFCLYGCAVDDDYYAVIGKDEYAISGAVRAADGSFVEGARISIKGAKSYYAISESNGFYQALLPKGTYTVTGPEGFCASNPLAGAGATAATCSRSKTVNLTSTAAVDFEEKAYTLAGEVETWTCSPRSCTKTPLESITVKATRRGKTTTATTGSDGKYTMRLGKGTYTVAAEAEGKTFDPDSTSVLLDRDREGVNFAECIFTAGLVPDSAAAASLSCLRTDWVMPDRYTTPSQHYTTRDGAIPAVVANPKSFEVRVFLKAGGKPITCGKTMSYAWTVTPSKGVKPKPKQSARDPARYRTLADLKKTGKCDAVLLVPAEGVYKVRLVEFEKGGGREKKTGRVIKGEVIVQDWVIVGMGDSFASGQGEPDDPGSIAWDPWTDRRWLRFGETVVYELATGPDFMSIIQELTKMQKVQAQPSWQFRQCDRSRWSHQAQAALLLEKADPRTSVTFIHTACSGARTVHIDTQQYEGQEPTILGQRQPGLAPQIQQVRSRGIGKGGREVDALLLSIGINDIYFGSIAALCSLPRAFDFVEAEFQQDPCQDMPVVQETSSEPALVPARMRPGVNSRPLREWIADAFGRLPDSYMRLFGSLNSALKVRPNRVYLVPYPDPTMDFSGKACGSGFPLGSIKKGWIFADETAWLQPNVVGGLRKAQRATTRMGWTYVSGAEDLFNRRGWCEKVGTRWIRLLDESLEMQGMLPFGAMHPTKAGQEAVAGKLFGRMCVHLYGNGTCTGKLPRKPGQKGPGEPGKR